MSSANEKTPLIKRIFGWAAVIIVASVAGFWAYWGGIENFHEGWYSESLLENLFIMFIQYWLFTIAFVVLGLLGLKFKKTILVSCILLAIGAGWFFRSAHYSVLLLIVPPIIITGLFFYFGDARPKWLARLVIAGIPALILVATTIWGSVMVSSRIDDGDYGARTIEGNGVCLVWAPEGPGWPEEGCSYEEAQHICAHLSEDGTDILENEANIWRLPTVEEAVASMVRHGENAGGVWDAETQKAIYNKTPDKETPLWKVHSQVIYYWTSTLTSEKEVFFVVYHGGVFTKRIDMNYGRSMSFRAVKDCGE